jgi:hypothetical protein
MATTAVTGDGTYQRLDAGAVRQTVQRLHVRITTRCPTRHLGDVAL